MGYELTPTEARILTLIACGQEDKAIATQLNLTATAVRSHNHRLFKKLSVENRVHAALHAWRTNVISIEKAWQVIATQLDIVG